METEYETLKDRVQIALFDLMNEDPGYEMHLGHAADVALAAIGLDDLDAAVERVARAIPRSTFISSCNWDEASDYQRQRRRALARLLVPVLFVADAERAT